jgi:hypothetical protein
MVSVDCIERDFVLVMTHAVDLFLQCRNQTISCDEA